MWTYMFTCLYFLFFFSSFLIPHLSAEDCNPDDKRALLEIKESFGNPYLLASWKNDTDCCNDWYQVKCDNNRITELTVFQGEISGVIPDAIGDLPYLKHLMFHKLSNLTGPIPEAITKLHNLNYIDFSWNNLYGPVPSFLAQLQNLGTLNVAFNSFFGSIPPSLSQLPYLSDLHLDRNQLTGSIPESFGSFKQGNFYIRLSHNMLSGPIPSTLGRVDFTLIDFSRNKLTGDASFLFGKDKKLQTVDLSRNQLEFEMTNVILGSSLTNIDMNHNKLYGSLPPSLADLPQLQFLNVSYNRFCGQIPTGGQLSRFDEFSYIHNKCLCGSPLPPCNVTKYGIF